MTEEDRDFIRQVRGALTRESDMLPKWGIFKDIIRVCNLALAEHNGNSRVVTVLRHTFDRSAEGTGMRVHQACDLLESAVARLFALLEIIDTNDLVGLGREARDQAKDFLQRWYGE